jgi:hypothetical protein
MAFLQSSRLTGKRLGEGVAMDSIFEYVDVWI